MGCGMIDAGWMDGWWKDGWLYGWWRTDVGADGWVKDGKNHCVKRLWDQSSHMWPWCSSCVWTKENVETEGFYRTHGRFLRCSLSLPDLCVPWSSPPMGNLGDTSMETLSWTEGGFFSFSFLFIWLEWARLVVWITSGRFWFSVLLCSGSVCSVTHAPRSCFKLNCETSLWFLSVCPLVSRPLAPLQPDLVNTGNYITRSLMWLDDEVESVKVLNWTDRLLIYCLLMIMWPDLAEPADGKLWRTTAKVLLINFKDN